MIRSTLAYHRSVIGIALLAVACLPPPPEQLAPVRLSVSRPPAEVVQVAARELVAAGFELTIADATGGILTAKRVRTPEGQGSDITCRHAKGSIAGTAGEATFTISLTAARAADSTAVLLVGAIVVRSGASVPSSLRWTDDATDCASAGVIEKQIAAAIQ